MRQRVQDLVKQGDGLFTKRRPLETLWQSIGDNFHVMRADFTRERYPSEEFAAHLMSGKPLLNHRDLTNMLPAMLRPKDQQWFKIRTGVKRVDDNPIARAWLDWATETQYNAMYAHRAMMVRATKECDGDYSAFGNGVIQIRPLQDLSGYFFRCHHLKNVVWLENAELQVCQIHRKWAEEVRILCDLFPKSEGIDKLNRLKATDPGKQMNCRHIILDADDYDLARDKRRGKPYVSVYVDIENEVILEEKAVPTKEYNINRWALVSGSQYAYSLATVIGMPDARMLQQMTLTLLEAGQKTVDPPLRAAAGAIQGGVNVFAGGLTWTDPDYDERTGPVLKHLLEGFDGLEAGAAREDRLEKMLDHAFLLNQLRMPSVTKEMTADETERVYEQFIREATPLLEPIEQEYSGNMCGLAFDTQMALGGFGSVYDMPAILRGADIKFEFESPLQAAKDKLTIAKFQAAVKVTTEAMQLNPNAADNFRLDKGHRDALLAAGAADWIVPEEERDENRKNRAQQEAAANAAQLVAQHADAATRVGEAAESAGNAAKALRGSGLG